jgi:hypothetical protein
MQQWQEGDWALTETELGLSLPEDYRELCGRFEPGTFSAYVEVLRDSGSDSLLANWRLLKQHTERFDQAAEAYAPFGLYDSAAGEGLLLWGRSQTEGEYYWRVDGSESADRWHVVARSDATGTWQEFEMSASEFIYHVTVDPEFNGFSAQTGLPFYLPATQPISSGEELAAWIHRFHPSGHGPAM